MGTNERSRLGGLVVLAAGSGLALHVVGVLAFATPSLHSWAALEQWYASVGPATAVVAVLRAVAMVASGWLGVASALQLVAGSVGGTGLRRLADGVSPRILRSLACGAASLSVTAGLTLPATPMGPPENPPGTAVMVPLDTTTTSTTAPPPPSTSTTSPAPTTTTTAGPTAPPAPAAPPAAAPARVSVPPPAEVVVAPGDSFWSIAVDEAGGRDVATYWRALIAANRDRLVDPSNPDLLYPAQVLRLP